MIDKKVFAQGITKLEGAFSRELNAGQQGLWYEELKEYGYTNEDFTQGVRDYYMGKEKFFPTLSQLNQAVYNARGRRKDREWKAKKAGDRSRVDINPHCSEFGRACLALFRRLENPREDFGIDDYLTALEELDVKYPGNKLREAAEVVRAQHAVCGEDGGNDAAASPDGPSRPYHGKNYQRGEEL